MRSLYVILLVGCYHLCFARGAPIDNATELSAPSATAPGLSFNLTEALLRVANETDRAAERLHHLQKVYDKDGLRAVGHCLANSQECFSAASGQELPPTATPTSSPTPSVSDEKESEAKPVEAGKSPIPEKISRGNDTADSASKAIKKASKSEETSRSDQPSDSNVNPSGVSTPSETAFPSFFNLTDALVRVANETDRATERLHRLQEIYDKDGLRAVGDCLSNFRQCFSKVEGQATSTPETSPDTAVTVEKESEMKPDEAGRSAISEEISQSDVDSDSDGEEQEEPASSEETSRAEVTVEDVKPELSEETSNDDQTGEADGEETPENINEE